MQNNLNAESSGQLFDTGSAKLSDFTQGWMGDCYFLSSVGGQVYRNATPIQSRDGNNVYTVNFKGYPRPIKVHLTQSEIAYAGSGRAGEIGQIVLEEAEGVARNHADREGFLEPGVRQSEAGRI